MIEDVSKPVVLITGATGGIGQACAKWFADCGYRLVLTGRDKALLVESFSSLDQSEHLLIESALANADEIKQVIQQIQKSCGGLDTLVHCAGDMLQSPLMMVREADIHQQLQVHLSSSILLAQFASRLMVRKKQGAMCFVSSIVAEQGAVGQAVYASAKAGVNGLVASLAKELGEHNIRVNSVAPGFIETNLVSSFDEEKRADLQQKTCLKRLGKPEDVAEAIGFLVSNKASYITGQNLKVDAGLVL